MIRQRRNRDKSLNKCLIRGPVLLHDLWGLLLRLVVSDIETNIYKLVWALQNEMLHVFYGLNITQTQELNLTLKFNISHLYICDIQPVFAF